MPTTQHGMTREMLTTFADMTTVAAMATPIDAVAEASRKLIEAIGTSRTFDNRLVAYERSVRKALPTDVGRDGPLPRIAEVMPLDRAVLEAKDAAEDALQLAVDEAKAAGATWDDFKPLLRIPAAHIGANHQRWAMRNVGRARLTYGAVKVGTTRFVVKRPTELTPSAALRVVERAQLSVEAHERSAELVRNELWRLVDLALASKWTYPELSEVTGLAESTLHKGHANWAALNHRTARAQTRPYDERRAAVMEALRGWAKENGGALPTGLKMWNDVPVGKKIRDYRLQFRKGRLDPEIAEELSKLFGDDWAEPAPPGSPQWVERMMAGKDAGT